jgi:hypothetical protein
MINLACGLLATGMVCLSLEATGVAVAFFVTAALLLRYAVY